MRSRKISSTFRWLALATTLVVLLGVGIAVPATAQTAVAGNVAGQVTDTSGAVVPGAKVALTDTTTGDTHNTTTNDQGRYLFSNMNPGVYKLTVTKAGFATATVNNQTIKVGVTTSINIPLKVGTASEQVEVTATNTELQTMNATVGNTINRVQLDNLPGLNRDVSTFVELQPGVSPDGSVAGTVVDQSSFSLDGGNNTSDMDGSMSVYTPSFAGDPTGGAANNGVFVAAGPTGVMPTPADSVEEFKVNSAGQTADFNSSSGAQVQVVTRRGGDAWHGSAYEYYLDNNFSANTTDNNLNGTKKPNWHRSRFGARIGGPILPKMLGGKTYFFANYEGYRWPQSATITHATPSAAMRLGLLTFGGVTYNLNPTPVTYNGVTYPGSTLDPRLLGVNPTVQSLWKSMPLPNANVSTSVIDGVNVGAFRSTIGIPQSSNFGVVRLDHDFGDRWHFMSSYRYFHQTRATSAQYSIANGTPTSLANRPQEPWYLVAGMTTQVSTNTTNDFRFSYLRNFWAWNTFGDVPQLTGLGGALEPGGESSSNVLAPYNVDTQSTRRRFWDGHDWLFRDDISMLHGNHLFQFGGQYQRNFDWHQRTDNGGGINYQPVYQLGVGSGGGISGIPIPDGFAGSTKNWNRDYAEVLGIVSIAQQAFTRSGANLALNAPLTPAEDKSTIPFYNIYFSDTWHMKPTFTFTYGLGWTLEMPPTEQLGRQVLLVDSANRTIDTEAYLHSREQAALQGQVYNPIVGYTLVGNAENGRKYPYNPFYGSFSPRVAAAWNPKADSGIMGKLLGNGNTVFRAGYGRIFGRLNGVDLVLVPLLGTGLIQPVQCIGPLMDRTTCASSAGADPSNAFRIGVDGLTPPIGTISPTLPQPLYPGVNGIAAGAGEALDPNFRPNVVDSVDFTIQRQVSSKISLEMGYIGRFIHHEYQPVNLNSVPYMMTLGGQRFDKAYAAMILQYCGGLQGLAGSGCAANAAAVTPQPFFEAALAGTGYCNHKDGTPYSSCTAALIDKEGVNGTGNIAFGGAPYANSSSPATYNGSVWNLWSDLDTGGTAPGFNFPRSMMNSPLNCPTGAEIGCGGQMSSGVGMNVSNGYGNYNGAFVSVKMAAWHGLTTISNFTWSKALTSQAVVQATSEDTAIDPFNLRTGYGYAGFDRRYVFNAAFVYQPEWYKGQAGLAGRLLGGWTIAPIFTAGSAAPISSNTMNGGGQAYGEGDSVNFFGNGFSENFVVQGKMPARGVYVIPNSSASFQHGVGDSGVGATDANGNLINTYNLYSNPEQAYLAIRQPILGLDTRNGGAGVLRGLGYWNVDLSLRKNWKMTERFSLETDAMFVNVLNHGLWLDGAYLDTTSADSFGALSGTAQPRQMEFGVRVNF